MEKQIGIPLGRWPSDKKANKMFSATLHRLPDELGAISDRERFGVSVHDRRAVPQELSHDRQNDPQATLPRLRSHLLRAFSSSHTAARRSAPQHVLQAFHLFRARVRSSREERARTVAGSHRQAHEQRGKPQHGPKRQQHKSE